MAYVTIADADIDPESPITTTLMTHLRDNPIAMMAKAAGAPVLANDYIVTAMITDLNVTSGKLAAQSVGQSKLVAPGAGTTYKMKALQDRLGYTEVFDTATARLFTATIIVAGIITVNAQLYANGSGQIVSLTIYKNGSVIGTLQHTTTTWTAVSLNIAVALGDVIDTVLSVTAGDTGRCSEAAIFSGNTTIGAV